MQVEDKEAALACYLPAMELGMVPRNWAGIDR